MPLNKEINTVKNYTVWSGGFLGGLFDSIDGALIPDNALHAISNLHIDHYGVLHSVTKPVENTDCYAAGLSGPIRSIMGSWANLFINRNGSMYNESNQGTVYTVDTNTAQVADSPADTAVRYYVRYTTGLWSTATGGTNITEADEDFPQTHMSSTVCEQEGRIWFNLAHILRGSDVTDPDLEETWRGPKDPVDNTMTLANTLFFSKMQQQIRYLLKMNGSLYIFCDDGIYSQNTFIDGTQRPVYLGAGMPRFGTGAPFRIYTDGQMAYWVGNNKFYAFSGSRPQVISDKLNLPAAVCWFTGEYDNRLWFLVCTATNGLPTGSEVNYIYAVDRDSGAWEKYDIQMTSAASPNIDTPTALMGGEDKSVGVRGDRLWIGTTLGKVFYLSPTATGTPLAWSFTTKTYTPSFDAYSRFVHFKIRYVGQAASSPVTVSQYVCRDGIAGSADTLVTRATTTLDMVGAGGGLFQKDLECHAEIGEGVYFTVSGTGTAQICDVGVEFSTRSSGDVNP
jgi:hypothetical protein